ncbi:DUF3817 domain-containing protein [Ochrovirga pacifica]|uniref:DUF3817 domain-containing protein n=1 Tax=Ochrovirga pacifica TaxID=1042376 RepID=UPI0002557B8E|nr:DUF3817 domain-containing protein [Ochrovirga pacifica]
MFTLKNFKIIALLEGISYLILLGIGTPLKHLTGNDVIVRFFGMPHGVLFVAYVIFAFVLKSEMKWNNKEFFMILICSVLPFGTFYADKKYLKPQV